MTSHPAYEALAGLSGGTEPLAFILSLVIAAVMVTRAWPLRLHGLFARVPNPGLGIVRASLLFSVPWLVYVFITGAASDIVGYYVAFYVVFAYACLLLFSFWRSILGLYYYADVLERSNLAAGIVFAGFVGGTAFAFGGALTGEGPGWIVVLVFFLLAYFELRANVALVSRLSGDLASAVRNDRDVSAALLIAGVCLGSGLISGRAAAGDFISWTDAMTDYLRRLWPMVLVPLAAVLVGFLTRSAPRPLAPRGVTALALTVFGAYFYFLT